MNWICFSDQAPPKMVDLVCWFKWGGVEVMYVREDGKLVDNEGGGWYTNKEDEPTHWCILDAPA